MQVCKTGQELSMLRDAKRSEKKIIGFVPTMGALHKGHISLIHESISSSNITVASIFVNPTQFNNPSDLKNYPRDLQKDLELLENAGCNIVFVPSVEEMYPAIDTRVFDFDDLDKVMEGQHRPGHFNGVAQIVSKLFDAVKPHKAFFGLKDFQQVAIIKKMTEKLSYNIEIIACPIVREPDGLAMSSRNLLLENKYRELAPLIYAILKESVIKLRTDSPLNVKKWVTKMIGNEPLLELEYFDIVDRWTLKSVEQNSTKDSLIGCIAVWAGNVRLIDNIIYNY
ncbi:MAG: pantoate--beta-alanine ligase [Salinivirgaceae bacterium]|jgi:pantoate--beta-alanine ligase|nr:pantoate--beta-alanine ligase [Salinivirgaceae bacterium]